MNDGSKVTLAEKYIEVFKKKYAVFIDYKQAFDRVKHENLITRLREIGLNGVEIRFVSNLFWEQVVRIRCENKYSPHINI